MGKKLFFYMFFAVSLIDIFAIVIENSQLRYIFKPLILIALIGFYLKSVKKVEKNYVIALFLCFLGDVFLLFKENIYFILGLSSFLLGHIFYIKIIIQKVGKISVNKLIKVVVPFMVFFLMLISILYTSLGSMLIPVVIYGLTICAMGVVSLYYYLEKKNKASLLFFIGACIFIISDSLIAINKFVHPRLYFATLVMITYVIAQYLICKSILLDNTTT